MPSSYRSMLTQSLPLTPPYTDGSYPQGATNYSAMPSVQNALGSNHQVYDSAPDDFTKSYGPPPMLAPYIRGMFLDYHPRTSSSYRGSMVSAKGPVLPPIQSRERPVSEYQQTQPSQTNPVGPPKDEKPVGGVAAHLDYEMDQMVDFVSESAHGMYELYLARICLADIDIVRSVNPNISVPPAFRKYVSQVLTSTRLPSSTILYGLYYLAHRMTELSKTGRYPTGAGQVYRMLTTALLLGSKFLDDNTFQNRSWSEVSNIPVQELNTLELEWLKSIEWDLHIDFNDPQGFKLWDFKWRQWQAMKVELSMESLKLNPLRSSIQRQPSVSKKLSPTLPYPTLYNEPAYAAAVSDRLPPQWNNARYDSRYDEWSAPASATRYSPPSAPHTGPNTPDWYRRGWYGNDYKSYGPSAVKTPTSAQGFQSFVQQASYQKPYNQSYGFANWSGHNTHCNCGYCMPQHDSLYGNFQHRSQPVAG